MASIAEDERQRQLQKPVDDDDEGAVSPDDDEDAYNAARQSFSAAQTKPRVKRASLGVAERQARGYESFTKKAARNVCSLHETRRDSEDDARRRGENSIEKRTNLIEVSR